MEKVHQITKINPNEHHSHLTCKWPAYGDYQVLRISDNDDTYAMLEMSKVEHTIKLYVEKDTVSHRLPEGHGEFTCMLDLDNESTDFISLVHNM